MPWKGRGKEGFSYLLFFCGASYALLAMPCMPPSCLGTCQILFYLFILSESGDNNILLAGGALLILGIMLMIITACCLNLLCIKAKAKKHRKKIRPHTRSESETQVSITGKIEASDSPDITVGDQSLYMTPSVLLH